MHMLKVYGAEICGECRRFKAIMESRGIEAEYTDITESVKNMREFLQLRDEDPVFAPVKERHSIGIPLFVKEDGTKTFDIDEALSWIGQPPVEDEEIVERRFGCGPDGC